MAAKKRVSEEYKAQYDKYLPFFLEIRKRIFYIASLFVVSSVLGFVYYEKIIRLILSLFRFEGVNIVFTSPFQFMNLAISSGFLVGSIVVFPMLLSQILSFLKPALKENEYRALLLLIPISLILFVGGFAFGSAMMRYIVSLFYQKSQQLDVGNILDISNLISQILVTAAAMGIGFQFPIVLTVLLKLGMIKYETISKQRILAYGASIIFAALLPPTDLLSLAALTLPLLILFEGTMLANKLVFKTHEL